MKSRKQEQDQEKAQRQEWDGETVLGQTLPTEHPWGGAYLEVQPTWRHRQLCHIHSSACLVGTNGVLVLLRGREVLGDPERAPGSVHLAPYTP